MPSQPKPSPGRLFHHNQGGGAEVTGGNEAGDTSGAYRFIGVIDSTCRGAFTVVSGNGVSTGRKSVADTAGLAEDVGWRSFIHGHAVVSRSLIGAFDTEGIVRCPLHYLYI